MTKLFTEVIHIKTGKVYRLFYIVTDATNARAGNKLAIYMDLEGNTFARDKEEFDIKFKVKPPECCVCGTTENVHKNSWYGYRCNSVDCMVF